MMDVRNYAVVTAAYWGFMLTDGALRMLVLLYFHTLGYSPFQLALLFLVYELMGVVTNALGGWLAARFGLKLTLTAGLMVQVVALIALSLLGTDWPLTLSVAYVVAVQGVSGIAKDLTKMSSKSAVKLVVPDGEHGALFRWVAILTGSKNAIKGIGFFVGAALLSGLGFQGALWSMAGALGVVWVAAVLFVDARMGRAAAKVRVRDVLSTSGAINLLSLARVFLFGARDVWFVVGVPVFLYEVMGWTFNQIGAFMAIWVIGYGGVQAIAPKFARASADGQSAEVGAAKVWIVILVVVPLLMIGGLSADLPPAHVLIAGLGVFGFVFAINSSVHSYLILAFSEKDGVSLNVGFYYMANAAGRLIGTLFSGLAYQWAGITGCLAMSAMFLVVAGALTLRLKPNFSLPATRQ